jgi:formylglycine-generating enzyme required for sulfatase activity
MDFVWIPAGSFKMGSLSSEGGHFDNESPRRDVALSRGFWMQRTEFTQAQYERLMQANPSAFREAGDDLPVDSVSWNQAQSCCRALQALLPGELKGWQMRLPTEAEWEYACRAGAGSRFHTGDLEADLDRGGWYQGNSGGRTHPVGRKQANAWGLLDTHGNVAEWCADAYARDYYRNGPRADPPGPGDGAYQVVRGGAFDGSAATCRAARRVAAAPTFADRTIGFRVVLGRK